MACTCPSGTIRCLGQYWCVTCHQRHHCHTWNRPWSCPTRWFLMGEGKIGADYNLKNKHWTCLMKPFSVRFCWYTGLIHSAQRKGRSLRPDCNGYPRQGKFIWPHPGFSIQYGSETVCLSGIDRAQHIKPGRWNGKILFVIDDVTHITAALDHFGIQQQDQSQNRLCTLLKKEDNIDAQAEEILKKYYTINNLEFAFELKIFSAKMPSEDIAKMVEEAKTWLPWSETMKDCSSITSGHHFLSKLYTIHVPALIFKAVEE